ncbi:hypothetical protein D9M70_421750 [compost metagenome]
MKITFGPSKIEALSKNLVLRKSKTFLFTMGTMGKASCALPAPPLQKAFQTPGGPLENFPDSIADKMRTTFGGGV